MRHLSIALFGLLGLAALLPTWGCGSGGTAATSVAATPPLQLTNFQPASVVVGQPDFTSNMANQGGAVAADTLNAPGSVASGSLYVADGANHRVLGYAVPPSTNGAPADFVLGQPDLVSNTPGTSATAFFGPTHVRVAGGKLFLVDVGNHRILIWNALPTSNVPANVVVGQLISLSGTPGTSATKFMQPSGFSVAGGRLIVADDLNNRVMIWNTIPTTNGAAADVVVGQPDFTSNGANQGTPTSPQAHTLSRPGSVWSDGTRLFVADSSNHRILIWNSIPVVNNTPADLVLGQPNFTSQVPAAGAGGLRIPSDLDSNGAQLFVTDLGNSRVLVWNTLPTSSSAPADVVLGQSDFSNTAFNDDDQDGTEDAGPSARTLKLVSFSYIRVIGNQLFVSDYDNNRVLIFNGL